MSILDLQKEIQNTHKTWTFQDFVNFGEEFAKTIKKENPTKIISPSDNRYVFYQFGSSYNYTISRPLNSELFKLDCTELDKSISAFREILEVIKDAKEDSIPKIKREGLDLNFVDSTIYTLQQSVGVIGDTLSNSNQSRKLVGQLFETLVRETLSKVDISTESRDINVPIPGSKRKMKFQLDFVFARNIAIVASETKELDSREEVEKELIKKNEIVGSVKTTSKDRIDKLFLDKYMLSKLLGRDIPVAAVFLHDVQRAKRNNNDFGIASTFKTGHFTGYSLALNKLDGVFYVDPRPVMKSDPDLKNSIKKFSDFLARDVWII